jgi:hypothetical protein
MPKSPYYWSHEEEKVLLNLWSQGEHNIAVLAAQVGRKPEAIRKKLARLGFVVGQEKNFDRTTTNKKEEQTRIQLSIPDDLPSVEEALKLLAGALNALSKPGLSMVEIQRFRSVVGAVKAYQKLFAEYVQYRKIEVDLLRMEAELAKETERRIRIVRRIWPRIVKEPKTRKTVFLKEMRD